MYSFLTLNAFMNNSIKFLCNGFIHVALFFTYLIPITAFSQQHKDVKNAHGQWVVSNDITISEARERAILEAKSDALRMAGVKEYIYSSNLLFTQENQGRFQEVFESLTSVEQFGEISAFEINREEKKIDSFGSITYDVWINATIIIHEEGKDQSFGFDIKNIRTSFNNHDKLMFQFIPWKDGYLNIFVIENEKQGMAIYPNNLELSIKFLAGQTYSFPRSNAMEYELMTSKKSELHYLVFLYTKDNIPFLEEYNTGTILKYISKIRPQNKSTKTYSIVIKE